MVKFQIPNDLVIDFGNTNDKSELIEMINNGADLRLPFDNTSFLNMINGQTGGTVPMEGGDDAKYRQKYLKYKAKYLKLKSQQ